MNTRFNPTCNGALHLGHYYTMLVNEQLAHSTGGKFFVRFDDVSSTPRRLSKERLGTIISQQMRDIEYTGLYFDHYYQESNLLPDAIGMIEEKKCPLPPDREEFNHAYFISKGAHWVPYPFCPRDTMLRVVMDHDIGITHLIRGEEFSTEVSYYSECCEAFGFETPQFIFLPRLMGRYGDISKTNGGYTLAELRGNGYSPQDLRDLLRFACLEYPSDPWDLFNLKREPRVNL